MSAHGAQPDQTRLALGAMLIPIFFVIGFALCIIGPHHRPHPHGINLAVAGPAARTAPLRAGIAHAAGSASAFSSVTRSPTPRTASGSASSTPRSTRPRISSNPRP